MNNLPDPEDLRVFLTVARKASFGAAADTLGVSPAYVSKRLRLLETRLGVKLLHRSTRRVTVTNEGEGVYAWAERILDDMDHLLEAVSASRQAPRGLLRISTSFGFGRNVVAPAIDQLVRAHPGIHVRLEVFDRLVDVAAEGFDLDVRVGDDIAPQMIAHRLAANARVLCASPAYVARRGAPRSVAELAQHDCVVIKERDHPFGVWRLRQGREAHTVKVTGPLSSNHGEIALQWALDGHGIILRSYWDVAPLLADGRLQRVLPGVAQEANVWAVHPVRLSASAKVRACVEFLQTHFARHLPTVPDGA